MPHYDCLIIGGGMTANAAIHGIRKADKRATIGLISAENHPPYKRPPLSKGLWKGEKPDAIWLNNDEADILNGRRVMRIDRKRKSVVDDRGDEFTYGRLLLATGGTVRRLPFDAEGVIYFRTYDDFVRLKGAAISGSRAVVIGGGFIGSEIAASLAMSGVSVSMIFPDEGLCSRVFPKKASSFLNSYYSSKQVRVIAGDKLTGVKGEPGRYELTTGKGIRLQSEIIVAGIGIQPDTALAASAGLEIDDGITVDEFLQTSATDIFAAGDVAKFFCPALDKRIRVEHEDNANMMGEIAGLNMCGTKQKYSHLPFFYSDLFDIGYEAVGEADSRMDTVEDWKKEFEEGVIYYLQDRKVRGVLLWNTLGQVENARALIEQKMIWAPDDLKGRLPA